MPAFSLGNLDIEHFWFVWLLSANFLFLKTLNKHINFYATGFIMLQYKDNLNVAPNCWQTTSGSVWFCTTDAVTQIHKRNNSSKIQQLRSHGHQ